MTDDTEGPDLKHFLIVMILLLICVGSEYYFHFILRTEIVYTHFFYIPAILSSLWWGLRGGLSVSLFLVFLHIVFHLPNVELSILSRCAVFIFVGYVVGATSNKLKQAEKKLRKKEEVKAVFRCAGGGIRVIDKGYKITNQNKEMDALCGVKTAEAVGRKCSEIFPSPHCGTDKCTLRQILSGVERVEVEMKRIARGGKTMWVNLIATPLKDEEEKVVGVIEDYLDITERKKAEEDLKERFLKLTALSKASVDIGSTLEMDKTLNLSLKSALKLLEAKSGSITLLDDKKELLTVVASHGLSKEFAKAQEKPGEGVAGYVARTGKPLLLKEDMKNTRFEKYKKKRKIKDTISVPIRAKDKIIGVFNVDNKEQGTFTPNDLRLFTILASEVGVATENAKLYQDIRKSLLNTVEALAVAVDAKDPYTKGHSERVARYSLLIAEEMGLSKEEIEETKIAARLHDVGKIGVNEEILAKPAPLSNKERKIVGAHPKISARILGPVDFPSNIISSVLSHHERIDGKGYPNGLSKDEIPLGASIIKVADAYDAMTADRPYREALSFEKAISELKKHSGTQFHPGAVEAFLRVYEKKIKIETK